MAQTAGTAPQGSNRATRKEWNLRHTRFNVILHASLGIRDGRPCMYIRDRGKQPLFPPPPPTPHHHSPHPQLACQVLNLEPQACVRCGSICDYTYKASGGASGLRVVLESRRQALGHTCWCQRLYRLVLLLRNDSTLYKEINSGVGGEINCGALIC